MKMPATLLKIAALATLATAGTANAATELVVNGSFENNVISSSWATLSSVTGWTSSASGNSAFEIQKGATQGGQGGFNPSPPPVRNTWNSTPRARRPYRKRSPPRPAARMRCRLPIRAARIRQAARAA